MINWFSSGKTCSHTLFFCDIMLECSCFRNRITHVETGMPLKRKIYTEFSTVNKSWKKQTNNVGQDVLWNTRSHPLPKGHKVNSDVIWECFTHWICTRSMNIVHLKMRSNRKSLLTSEGLGTDRRTERQTDRPKTFRFLSQYWSFYVILVHWLKFYDKISIPRARFMFTFTRNTPNHLYIKIHIIIFFP